MLDLVLSLSVLSAHPQRMVTLFLGPGVFRIDCKSVSFRFTDIDNYQEHMQPWKQRLADEAQAPQLSGLQKLTLVHECESTHRHKHSWPLWGHQTWTQQHLHLIFRNTRRYQNPQGKQRNCRKQTRFLVASDLQQSFNPAGKTQQTQITIHLRLSAVERERPGHQAHILRHTWPRMRLMAQSQHTQWLFMKLKDAPEEWGQEIQGAQICVRNNWKVWPCLVTFKAGHDQPIHIPTSSSFLSLPLTSSRLTNLQHHSCKSTTRLSWQNQFGNPC